MTGQPVKKPRKPTCKQCGGFPAMAYRSELDMLIWLCGSCVYQIEHPGTEIAPLKPGKIGVVRKQRETLF